MLKVNKPSSIAQASKATLAFWWLWCKAKGRDRRMRCRGVQAVWDTVDLCALLICFSWENVDLTTQNCSTSGWSEVEAVYLLSTLGIHCYGQWYKTSTVFLPYRFDETNRRGGLTSLQPITKWCPKCQEGNFLSKSHLRWPLHVRKMIHTTESNTNRSLFPSLVKW